MSALIPILAVLVFMGSFLWLKPSKRDQRLAKIRSEALVNGFRLGSLKISDMSENGRVNDRLIIVTVYQIPFEYTDQITVSFTALRTSGESGIHLPVGWQWDDRSNLEDVHHKGIFDFLSELPTSVTVISVDRDVVSLSWDEKDPDITFDVLKRWLIQVAGASGRDLHSSVNASL